MHQNERSLSNLTPKQNINSVIPQQLYLIKDINLSLILNFIRLMTPR
jgi:hypothetical protein